MEKTLRSEKAVNVLKEEFLDDNALLIFKELNNKSNGEKGRVEVVMQYIENRNCLREVNLFSIDCTTHNERFLSVSADNSTIAIFDKEEENYYLNRVYDVSEHNFVADDFKDIVYREKFPERPLTDYPMLIKK